MREKQKKEMLWYDNANTVTNLIIGLIFIIVILSQSFAINNGLTTGEILRNIVNHNSIYFIALFYFIALKTHTGKKYFDFLNLFLIGFYFVTSITSLLTVFQTFSLLTLVSLALHVLILIYLVHTFLRNTRLWEDFKLNLSPFNEIKNDAYFYSVVILEISFLSLNLIFSNSLDGTILSLLDTCYGILFARYIYLYGYFLDIRSKKKVINTTMEEVMEKVDEVKEKLEKVVDNVLEKVEDVKEEVDKEVEKIKTSKTNKTSKTSKKKGDK